MTRHEIMVPFRMKFSGAFIHQDLRMTVEVKETQARTSAEKAHEVDVAIEGLRMALTQAFIPGWRYNPYSGEPSALCPPEPENMSAEQHHARIDRVYDILTAAGVMGAGQVRNLPAGWTTVLEIAAKGIVARMGLPDAVQISIRQMKEKFGGLRLYLNFGEDTPEADDFRRDILLIAQWAEAVTETRCAVTGKPAEADNSGWLLYLTPEMAQLRRSDKNAFADLIYPPIPQGA